MSTAPDTIVLIHGFWVTPRSWEDWIAHYEKAGLPRARARLPRLRGRGRGAQRRPVADRGRDRARRSSSTSRPSSAGSTRRRSSWATPRAACSPRSCSTTASAPPAWRSTRRPPRASRVVPLSQVKATFPVLKNPANRHKAVGFTFEQWHYAFTNTFSEEQSRELYERYHIPASGAIFWGSALANIHPGKDDNWVDYHNDDRAPLLFISGSEDHLMPPKIQQSNAKHYKSDTDHRGQGVRGPAPAARAGRAGRRSPTTRWTGRVEPRDAGRRGRGVKDVRLTHIGGPTVLIEVGGWRLLTDPTFDPPGRRYSFGWGTASRKLAGPAIAAADLPPIDAVLLSHDHHGDNLDDAGRALLPSAGVVRDDRRPARGGWAAARAGSSRGRRPGSRRPTGPRSRSPRRRAGTARRCSHPIVGDVDRLRAALGGPGATACCGSPATPCSTTACARSPTGSRSTPRCCTWAACVRGHRARALHDDRRATRVELCGLVRPRTAIPSTTRAGSTSARAARRSRASSRRRREDVRRRVRWLPIGEAVDLAA